MDGRRHTEGRAGDGPRQGTLAERVALAIFAGAAGYFLWTEHRAHVVEYLPWAILALCPLMHLFMHRGHSDEHSIGPGSGGDGQGR